MDCDKLSTSPPLMTTERKIAEIVEPLGSVCGNESAVWLQFIETKYGAVHGHASIGMCIMSILMNIANVVVLTRRHMVSPSNTLLTAIAFVDIMKMSTYMFYAYFFNITSRLTDPSNRYSASLVLFLILHTNSALVLHCNNTWLTVLLAVFRYIVVCVNNGRQMITVQLARKSVALVFLLSCLAYIPHYFSLGMTQECESPPPPSLNESGKLEFDQYNSQSKFLHSSFTGSKFIDRSANERELYSFSTKPSETEPNENRVSLAPAPPPAGYCSYHINPNEQLQKLSHLIHGPVLKILSSIIICIPTVLLIARMREAAKNRKRLKKAPQHAGSRTSLANNNSRNRCCGSTFIYSVPNRLRDKFSNRPSQMSTNGNYKLKCEGSMHRPNNTLDENAALTTEAKAKISANDHTRTTTMLIAVITSFVVVEFPQGIILWVGHFNKFFFECVYSPLGDLFDALVLLSSTINFLIYCTMSQQYRQTFRSVLIEPLLLHRKTSPSRILRKDTRSGTGTGAGLIGNNSVRSTIAARTSVMHVDETTKPSCSSCSVQVAVANSNSNELSSLEAPVQQRSQNILTLPISAV